MTRTTGGKGDPVLLKLAHRMVVANLSQDVEFKLYGRLLRTPLASQVYMRYRWPLCDQRITSMTKLVVDGFPRSANTYTLHSLNVANPGLGHICSHMHSPTCIKQAVRRSLPCIVLVRDPRECVASLVQMLPGLSATTGFEEYVRYYERVQRWRADVVIAHFPDVVGNIASVVDACNAKFGTQLQPPRQDQQSRDDVMARIEEHHRLVKPGVAAEAKVARPSAARLGVEDFLSGLSNGDRAAMNRAVATYMGLLEDCTGPAHGFR